LKILHTEIEIEASTERIWQILTDFDRFPEWNPFIRRISGELRVGSQLEALLQPPDSRGMTFRPTLLKLEPERELRWLGRLWLPGLFDGEHIFTIEPLEGGCVLFVQREEFRGLLVPLLMRNLEIDTRRGFEAMNRAIKERAESPSGDEGGDTRHREHMT
jgi:hypothetical protein